MKYTSKVEKERGQLYQALVLQIAVNSEDREAEKH